MFASNDGFYAVLRTNKEFMVADVFGEGVASDLQVQGLKPEHSLYLEFHRQRVFQGNGASL